MSNKEDIFHDAIFNYEQQEAIEQAKIWYNSGWDDLKMVLLKNFRIELLEDDFYGFKNKKYTNHIIKLLKECIKNIENGEAKR